MKTSVRKCRSRKEFLLQLAGLAAFSRASAAAKGPRVLIVVAHPDDEYAVAATVYRITQELGGTVDQVVLTNGEAGYRYSRLAETFYGMPLTKEEVGRTQLPSIRKEETLRAGRILGIRQHWFLNQKDARFTLDGSEAFRGIWDVRGVLQQLKQILSEDSYDFVFTLLPTQQTHGHHQAAALLALQAVAALPTERRPAVLGSEPSAAESVPAFAGRTDIPAMRLEQGASVLHVSRLDSFGPGGTLNYNIVVNWVIAEHKSQGLFQTECGKHSRENFWVFDTGAPNAVQATKQLFHSLAERR